MASQPVPLNPPSAAFVAQFVADIQARIDHDNAVNQSQYEIAFKNWVQNQETQPAGMVTPPEPDPNRYPLFTLDQKALAAAFLAYSEALYMQAMTHSGPEPILSLTAVMTRSAPSRLKAPSVPTPVPGSIVIDETPINPGTPFHRAVSGDNGYVPEGFPVTQNSKHYTKQYSIWLGGYWLEG